ncbi:MAG TPA: YihY/virulence factor BrkB family protein [Myxococcota bacterium]|nr:YihY/virulence factor BrkB family protein [Myxococcota bacterium]
MRPPLQGPVWRLAQRAAHWHPSISWVVALTRNIVEHQLVDRAAQMAYFLLFAVFPFLVALLGILSLFDLTDEVAALDALIADAFPEVIGDLLVGEVHRVAFAEAGGRIVVGLAVSLYASQRAIAAGIRGVNTAWGTDEGRNFFLVRGIGIVITLATMGSAIIATLLLTLGAVVIEWVTMRGWLDGALATALTLLRWPIVLLMLHGVINLLYRFGANTPMRWSWSTYGSLTALAGIVLVTVGFQAYVEGVTDLGATYGSLGAAIGMLLYFYLVAGTIFLGAEVDALNWSRRKGPVDDRFSLLR